MSDMTSGPSLTRHLVLLIQSGILPYSPNSLPLASKLNSTHGLLTSSTLVDNMWLSTESVHLLSLLRLEYPQDSVLGPVLFLIFINDLSDSLENLFHLFADDSNLVLQIDKVVASSLSSDLDKITRWSNTWNMSFNPDKSHTLAIRKDHLANYSIHFLNNPLEDVQSSSMNSHSNSWVSLSAINFLG